MWLLTNKPKEEAEEVVKCEDCGVLVTKEKSTKVLKKFSSIWDYNSTRDIYYCQLHTKPYEILKSHSMLPDRCYSVLEVSKEDGTPIGYKKIK